MSPRRAALVLAAIAGGAAAAVCVLAVATDSVLRSGWVLGQIDGDPDVLFVTFSGPRVSLVPGRLSFAEVTIRSRDPNVEWEARLEGVRLNVVLADLLARRFHAGALRADVLSFRLRERLERSKATPARLARYPSIEGFRGPPLVGRPPTRPAPEDPWRLVLDDVRVSRVREIWIGSWRWRGEATLSGGFFLRPGFEAEVFPSELVVGSGTLEWGRDSASRRTRGVVRASLPHFETHEYPGNDVWKILSGTALLSGSLDTLAFLSPDGPSPVEGGGGSVRAGVRLEDGRGEVRATIGADRLKARIGAGTLRGSARARVVASRLDFRRGVTDLSGTFAELHDVRIDGVAGPAWTAKLDGERARLEIFSGALDAQLGARVDDARPLLALLPHGPPRWLGTLAGLRSLDARGRLLASPGHVALVGAHADGGTLTLDADVRAAGDGPWGAVLVRKGALSVGVGIGAQGRSLHAPRGAVWFESEARPGGLRTPQPADVARRAK